jgi:hypothetical protein
MLNEKPDKNPFKVPENYFEDVNRKIISVTSGNDSDVRKSPVTSRFRSYLLVAASVTGFVLLSYTAVKLLTQGKEKFSSHEVSLEAYTDQDISDIDIISIEDKSVSLVFSDEGPDVNKTDIIDYLLQENIELNDIYERL